MSPIKSIEIFYDNIINKNVEGIRNAYVVSENTYVILEGPRFTTRGYENIAKGWGDFCSSPIDLIGITWLEGPFEEMNEGMAFLAGIIELAVALKGKLSIVKFRASFVLLKVGETWLIKHEHVSAPMQDPYGIGDWLKK